MRAYYGLQERHGVRFGLAVRVRHDGRPGIVVDTSGRYLLVRLDDDPRHVTHAMEYETRPGEWAAATSRPGEPSRSGIR